MIDTDSIKLSIVHDTSLHSTQTQCCEVSVPLPQALVFSLEQLSVKAATDEGSSETTIDALCLVLAHWPDNSLKWVKLTYQYCNQPLMYLNILKNQPPSSAIASQKVIEDTDASNISDDINHYSYKGGDKTLSLSLAKNQLELLDDTGEVLLSISNDDLKLIDEQEQPVKADFTQVSVSQQINLKNSNHSAVSFAINGLFLDTLVEFQLLVDWLVPFDLIKFELQIHNTNRAIHQGGKWDLGDPGSFNFKALSLCFNTAEKSVNEQCTVTDIQNNHSYNGDSITCEQFSSGGVNWQSPVHVNHNNTLDIKQNGYVLSIDQKQHSGMRCQPVLGLKNNLVMTLEKFWQNFPKSLSVKDNTVSFGLFPETHYLHELQGGEKKNLTFWLSLNGSNNDLTTSDKVNRGSIAWDWISQCDLYPFMEKEKALVGQLQSIIDLGISKTLGFIAKREKLDEYGWRNFGELWADHETAGYQGDDIFVSHYNNQYDPIYGFLRQYLTTGNTKWFELADDLATHVKDIDIYHTRLDKNEYNGGLFWHTDHYLQAFTSSHRSYSKHQASDAYQDHAGGGGPGGQHCYTTGLYLHYCLTGSQSSKDAVLTLSNWITQVYEGSGTCIELLLAFKNRHVAGNKN
ncbi:MAG: hypothetical protein JKY14_05855, partial [Paraglaciecola sp.]|nr:hypothetical protein [Paraglaciecola sp.]